MTVTDRANRDRGIDRRSLMAAGFGVAAVALSSGRSVAAGGASANPMTPIPIPSQMPAKEGMAEIAGKRLYYWDTGGSGTPIVLSASFKTRFWPSVRRAEILRPCGSTA